MPLAGEPDGLLLWRDRMCEHVETPWAGARTRRGDPRQRRPGRGLRPASRCRVRRRRVGTPGQQGGGGPGRQRSGSWCCRPRHDDPYWFGDPLSPGGRPRGSVSTSCSLREDADRAGDLPRPARPGRMGPAAPWSRSGAANRAVDVDRSGPRCQRGAVRRFPPARLRGHTPPADAVTVTTGLPAIAAEVAIVSRPGGRVTVPVPNGPLPSLLGCVLWLVLPAGADQRRARWPARLRPGGRRPAPLLGETLPPVIAGVPVGTALAVGPAARGAPFFTPDNSRRSSHSAAVGALIAVAGMVARRAVRPEGSRAPPSPICCAACPLDGQGSGWACLEAMLVAVAGATFAAMVTGSISGPIDRSRRCFSRSRSSRRRRVPPARWPVSDAGCCGGLGPSAAPSRRVVVARDAGGCAARHRGSVPGRL